MDLSDNQEQAAISLRISEETKVPRRKVEAAIDLLESGNTIPFIARYRKEATGGLDELQLRAIEDSLEKAAALASRKGTVLKSIDEQGLLTAELRQSIENAADLRALELIYLPFKPKRRTRAAVAREAGLQPLADLLLQQEKLSQPKTALLAKFIDPDKGIPDSAAALQGALDIVAEQWSEGPDTRKWLADQMMRFGKVTSQLKRGKKDEAGKFEQYLDRQEAASRIPSHRLLAMLRGENEGILKVGISLDRSYILNQLKAQWIHNRQFEFFRKLAGAAEDCLDRLLHPATQSMVLQTLREQAEEVAINVFQNNLQELLMGAPAGPRVTIGIDPGFRTGCKVAVVDQTGKFLTHKTIFPTPPKNDFEQASHDLLDLIRQYKVELIAIGNGTASRETDAFVGDLIQKHDLQVTKVMVSESGASIYSASEIASREFPDLDLTVRGAISIARRLQDPLAELVKTDPKSIGVGQYQHDVNQTLLRKSLNRTVESCVNQVGVDLNMASVPLLSHVSGIGPKLAENIVSYRNEHGRFKSRNELNQVPKLGKKAFEQAAGFLRIRDGVEPLDNSAVHPESYFIVSRMAQKLSADPKVLVGNAGLSAKLNPSDFQTEQCGIPTIVDIIHELEKPGRDPRSEFRVVEFDQSVNEIKDLAPEMVLEGVITNVTHFGAFIDIGVHQDALIHISQLSDTFVSDPNEVVSVGDILKVKVLEVDIDRKRISVTRKF